MALLFAAAAGACVSYVALKRKSKTAVQLDSKKAVDLDDGESICHDAGQPKKGNRVAIVTGGSR